MSCAIALQAALDREQDANRLLRESLAAMSRESGEKSEQIRWLEQEREQLRLMVARLQREGWRKPIEQGDMDHD